MMQKKLKRNGTFCLTILFFVAMAYFIFKGGDAIAAANSFKEQSQYVEVVINKGDTLWNLAKKYGNPQKDPRVVVYQIQDLNGLNPMEFIQPGQILKIPIN